MSSRLVALTLALGACTTAEPLAVEHRSVLSYRTLGMALDRDGMRGHAGMAGTTCDFGTRMGLVDADYDFEGQKDTVTDGTDGPDGFTTVVVTGDGVHVVRPEDGSVVDVVIGKPDHGVLVGEDDVVVIGGGGDGGAGGGTDGGGTEDQPEDGGGCDAGYFHVGKRNPWSTFELPAAACDRDAQVSSDRDQRVYVGTPDGVVVVEPDGWTRLDATGDLVAWDVAADALYLANAGEGVVRALEADGTLRWEADVGGAIRAVGELGSEGAAVVSVQRGDAGAVVFLDGTTGDVRADVKTPSAARDLVASGDGSVVGLVLKDETHFYDTAPLGGR
ncbi:MAG: PQQ-like beta-propeller repeat protein [Myxococcales bacterium]|nr:PQQ-like beta-propeller repeat protein [Myxococcales bacterium]